MLQLGLHSDKILVWSHHQMKTVKTHLYHLKGSSVQETEGSEVGKYHQHSPCPPSSLTPHLLRVQATEDAGDWGSNSSSAFLSRSFSLLSSWLLIKSRGEEQKALCLLRRMWNRNFRSPVFRPSSVSSCCAGPLTLSLPQTPSTGF